LFNKKFDPDAAEKVSKFQLPSFEGTRDPQRFPSAGKDRKAPPPPKRTPADIEKEAYAKGFEEGRRAGTQSFEKEAAPLLSGLCAAVDGVQEFREMVVREIEPQVVELALAVARRILIGELSESPERVVEIVKEAIRRIERTGAVTIRVHPDLSDAISSLKGRSAEFQADILLDIDPSVPPNGPVVVGSKEEIHTDIDEQIRVIAEELRAERAAH
jgi:flagellar assembly protein FliH